MKIQYNVQSILHENIESYICKNSIKRIRKIYIMSDLNHRLVLQHLRNLNHLLNTFDESSQILQQYLQRNRTNNTDDILNNMFQSSPSVRNTRTRTRQHSNNHNYFNNTVPSTQNNMYSNSNDDTTYILRFETLLPELINNLTRKS